MEIVEFLRVTVLQLQQIDETIIKKINKSRKKNKILQMLVTLITLNPTNRNECLSVFGAFEILAELVSSASFDERSLFKKDINLFQLLTHKLKNVFSAKILEAKEDATEKIKFLKNSLWIIANAIADDGEI